MGAIAREAVLVAPRGFFSGFPVEDSPARVFDALREMGFAEIRLAEEWEEVLRVEARERAATGQHPLPIIPPLCPAVVALVESRFPSLIPHLGPWVSPLEAAGEEFPLRPVVLVSACPAQFAACSSASLTDRLTVVTPARLPMRCFPSWAANGSRELSDLAPRAGSPRGRDELAVSGIRHVLRALSAAESGALGGTTLLDLAVCETGCPARHFCSADPFLSMHRWQQAAAIRHERQRRDTSRRRPQTKAVRAALGGEARPGHGGSHSQALPHRRADAGASRARLRCMRRAELRDLCGRRRAGTRNARRLPQEGDIMTLGDITARLGLEILTPELSVNGGAEVVRAHASDLLSDVLANAPSGGLLLTIQVHMNVVAVALHAGLAAVIFTAGMRPEESVRLKAVQEGLPLLAAAESTFDIAGKLYALGLRGQGQR